MTTYHFETKQLGLSDTGIHLLREGYNYETIDFSTIHKIEITTGRQVKNWFLLLLIAVSLVLFGIYSAFVIIYEFFFANNYRFFNVEEFLLPVIPLLLGTYSLYHSFKIGYVLKVSIDNKIKQFPIDELKENDQIARLSTFLNENNLTKHLFNPIT
jgi:hypothetical protein